MSGGYASSSQLLSKQAELKKAQATPNNFINKFLDEQGLIKDAAGYHRSLAVAMNPERFAKFFYEQGQADAIDGTMKGIKNIQMSENIQILSPSLFISLSKANTSTMIIIKLRTSKQSTQKIMDNSTEKLQAQLRLRSL